MSNRQAEQEALQILNRVMGGIFSNRASWHWYSPDAPVNKSRAQDRYFYTAEKVSHGERTCYLSGVYRYNASSKKWKALKKAGHRTKRQAMDRALKMAKENV